MTIRHAQDLQGALRARDAIAVAFGQTLGPHVAQVDLAAQAKHIARICHDVETVVLPVRSRAQRAGLDLQQEVRLLFDRQADQLADTLVVAPEGVLHRATATVAIAIAAGFVAVAQQVGVDEVGQTNRIAQEPGRLCRRDACAEDFQQPGAGGVRQPFFHPRQAQAFVAELAQPMRSAALGGDAEAIGGGEQWAVPALCALRRALHDRGELGIGKHQSTFRMRATFPRAR